MIQHRAHRHLLGALLAAGAVLAAGPRDAGAGNPEFKFEAKPEKEVEKVKWQATAQGGLILTTGNSQTTSLSASAKTSREAGANKLQLEASLVYARSTLLLAQDSNGNGSIDSEAEIDRQTQTTNESYLVKGRYDRFLTEHQSLYGSSSVARDVPAGKDLVAGGQVGYSRRLYKDDVHELRAEAGYDYSYEDLSVGSGTSIHSLRGFVGYAAKLSGDTGFNLEVEALSNMNPLENAAGKADTFEDTRVNGTTSLTTKILGNISFRFAFGLSWDNFPAPRPALSIPYADGFVPLADELDTKTEASLIVSFL